ncbi:3-methyladenine DNA glycosylase [uncultured Aeromicrobium sp.]|uniref:3-methyladenine DNA glycosylase n=1 Tax=uncultured Aeromicrobium sp. TaxID=337820 RepID=UPI0025EB24FE|nr:3-methyladenine DNA glycosylase [uncultured Aeromicrobium sp.]
MERRERGQTHPVHDFLFEYYNLSPGALERWHPGVDVALADAPEYHAARAYVLRSDGTVTADVSRLPARLPGLRWTRELLRRTADRAPRLQCFGLHEWAMVYRAPDDRRHAAPLRLGAAGTDEVVEAHKLVCTHVDAFRFYTDAARPLNRPSPVRERQLDLEQPGCLHANMDLYRIAFRMLPFIDASVVADAFVLAVDVREVDMRASPYDLSAYGYEPITVETNEGKAEYVRRQREFARRAEPLRRQLLSAANALIVRAEQEAA